MKNPFDARLFFAFAGFLLCSTLAMQAASDEAQVVKKANADFYTAINRLFTGEMEAMNQVWSHAEDVTYLPPDGSFQVGWKAVQANWEKQAALKLGGKIQPEETHVTVGDTLAVVQCFERGDNTNVGKQPVSISIRATNVFRKEEGQWKMIGHHADVLSFLKK